jgi:hypothetical protein
MARTYREIAIEEMLGTVEEAMSQVPPHHGFAADLIARAENLAHPDRNATGASDTQRGGS